MQEEDIIKYLSNNPNIIQKYLDKNGTYNVFFRQQDTHIYTGNLSHDIHLIKTFISYESALDFVLNYGKDIVDEEQDNYGTPIVLTIIPFNNEGVHYQGESPTQMNLICTNEYPTFAFSEDGYQMLIREHKDALRHDCQNRVNPYWFNRYDGKNFVRGVSEEEFIDIQNTITYIYNNEIKKKEEMEEFREGRP